MPVADLVLAELPAEEDGLAAAPGGKVDQPLVGILHLRTRLVDLVDGARELPRDAVDLGRCLRERRRRNGAAVALDVPFELLLPLERADVRAPLLDHPLDERPHDLE